jgi:ABC-type branched-subunit amino acid transport system substrate-binding protein
VPAGRAVGKVADASYAARVADSGFRLGIDFGTSNTVAVLRWPDGRVKSLLFDGSPLLPSAVYVDPQGTILAGRDAVHSSRLQPHRFEPYPKRRIEDGTVWLGDREINAIELVAAVLRRVATEAVRVAGVQPREVMLTHPAAWGPQRRDALVRAAVAAGLPTPQLAAEPVAAASYFVGTIGTNVPVGGCAVVYDFGAGTFDASVVRRSTGGGFEVLSSEGLTDAGGLDVDAAIVTHLGSLLSTRAAELWGRLRKPETEADRRAAWQLWEDVRLAKEMLSRAATTYVHVPLLDESVPLGREELEQLARPILDRTVMATQLAVDSAGIRTDEISAIFLVGGSSRIPLAATLLHRAFGMAATAIEQPELVVAEGSLQLSPPTGRASVVPPVGSSPAASPLPGFGAQAPVSGAPVSGSPVSGPPVSGPPVSGPPVSGPPVSGPPVSGSPVSPVGGAPVPVPSMPGPPRPPVSSPPGPPLRPPPVPRPVSPGTPVWPHAAPRPPAPPAPPARPPAPPARPPTYPPQPAARRLGTPLLIALIAVGLVVLAVGGGGVYWALRSTAGVPTSGPSATKPGGGAASPACGYKIAYLGVLSGSNAADGTMVRDSVSMALEQYNKQHESCTAQLVDLDTNTTTSTTLAQQIVDDQKILGVVGPLYLNEVNAALPIFDRAELPAITPAATETGLSTNGWKVFHRTLGSDLDQAAAAARYLSNVVHAKKTVVVSDDTDYGRGVSAEVSRALGSAAVGLLSIKRDDKDFSGAVSQVNGMGADAVYLGTYYDDGGLFVKQLRATNKTIKIVAGDRAFTDGFITAAGKDVAEGVIMTCPCSPASRARDNFANQFKAKFGRSASYYGPEAFDATNVLLAGMQAGAATRADMLKFVKRYDAEGVSRRIKFSANGDLDVTSLQVWAYRVSNGYVDPEQVIPET